MAISGGNASIYVSDMERAIAFYVQDVGLKLRVRIANEWAELDAGGGLTVGLHPAYPGSAQPGTIGAINIELAVDDLDAEVAALQSRGVHFPQAIQEYENVRLAVFLDPDQNVLLLAQVLNKGT